MGTKVVETDRSISTVGQANGPAIGACAATNAPAMAPAMGGQLGVVTV